MGYFWTCSAHAVLSILCPPHLSCQGTIRKRGKLTVPGEIILDSLHLPYRVLQDSALHITTNLEDAGCTTQQNSTFRSTEPHLLPRASAGNECSFWDSHRQHFASPSPLQKAREKLLHCKARWKAIPHGSAKLTPHSYLWPGFAIIQLEHWTKGPVCPSFLWRSAQWLTSLTVCPTDLDGSQIVEKLLKVERRQSRPPRVISGLMEPREKNCVSFAKLSDANSCALLKHHFQQWYVIATYFAYAYATLMNSELQINLIRLLLRA